MFDRFEDSKCDCVKLADLFGEALPNFDFALVKVRALQRKFKFEFRSIAVQTAT